MKKFKALHIILALILALSPITASGVYADWFSQEVEACRVLGILVGSGNEGITPKYLSESPTRLSTFIIVLRLKGLDSEAQNYSSAVNFKDSGSISWAIGKSYLAYAKNNPTLGWQGKPDGSFAPNDKMDAKSFYKVMLETLGYKQDKEFTFPNTLSFAASKGLLSNPEEYSQGKAFTVSDVAKAIYNTLNTKPKNSDKKLITLLVEQKIFTREKAAEAGLVLDAETINVLNINAVSNNRLALELDKEMNIDKSSVAITGPNGQKLSIMSISSKGKDVSITTADAIPFSAYEIKINALDTVSNRAIKNYTNTYVALPRDTVKPTVQAEAISNTELVLTFSEAVDKESAENTANYTIMNNLPVISAQLDSTGKLLTLKTAEQTEGYLYQLTAQNVADLSGNVIDKYQFLFSGMEKDITKPFVISTIAEGNRTVAVTFNEKLFKSTAENINNYIVDNNLSILEAKLSEDGKVVLLKTSPQAPNIIYNITVQYVADAAGNVMYNHKGVFQGAAGDTIKPEATALVLSNTEVQVNFSEKVDKNSAEDIDNYSIDKDLKVQKAILDSTGKTVTLITSRQTAGTLYTISISNVTDLAGNVMNYYSTLFGGMPEDNTEFTYTVNSDVNKVVLTFNKKLDKSSAENTLNYSFDNGLGYPVKAELDYEATGKVVTLTTSNQQGGRQYSVTVRNVTDIAGNRISSEERLCKKYFIGTGNIQSGLTLQTIVTIDTNTVDLVFDDALSQADLNAMQISIISQNGAEYKAPQGLAYAKYYMDSSKARIRAQFRTAASTNPDLFTAGTIYEIRVSGISRLPEDTARNTKPFAGVNKANEAPYITSVVALNSTAVQVYFSEPVTNISSGEFVLSNGAGITGVSALYGDVVDNVTLYLSSYTPLANNTLYTLSARGNIKDAAGFNSISTAVGRQFVGTSVPNAAPYMTKATVLDRYTINIEFSEPVKNTNYNVYNIVKLSGGSAYASGMVYSKAVPSEDGRSVTLYFDANYAGLENGVLYEISCNSSVADMQNLAIDSAKAKQTFLGQSLSLPPHEVAATSISSDNKEITLLLTREADAGLVPANCFEFSGADYRPGTADRIELNGKIIKFVFTNPLKSKDVFSIKLTALGKSVLKDYNSQRLSNDIIQINTK